MTPPERPQDPGAEADSPARPRGLDDPLVQQAAREVDPTLLDWALSLSPRERLRACTRATNALSRFARDTSLTWDALIPKPKK